MDEVVVLFCTILVVILGIVGVNSYVNNKDNATMIELVSKGIKAEEAYCMVKGKGDSPRCIINGLKIKED